MISLTIKGCVRLSVCHVMEAALEDLKGGSKEFARDPGEDEAEEEALESSTIGDAEPEESSDVMAHRHEGKDEDFSAIDNRVNQGTCSTGQQSSKRA